MDAQRLDRIFSRLLENVFLEPAVTKIAEALDTLASHPSIAERSTQAREAHEQYLTVLASDDVSEKETALLELYLRLHALGWSYSDDEEQELTRAMGNRNIPGGLAPLVMAGEFIMPESVSVDLGAGNGLQGLLMQYLYPHRKTIQIELSSSLIKTGRGFQKILGIPDDRVAWLKTDIRDADISGADFVYLYRPVRPYGEGNDLYRSIAEKLSAITKPVVVISVADCLGRFLDGKFLTLFHNEHISVFRASDIRA